MASRPSIIPPFSRTDLPLTMDGMQNAPKRHPLISGTRVMSLGTLASRVLGMLRDMATAALLGLAGKGGVADAFWFAFRIPNLFRELFGEGALSSSYLPVLTAQVENDRDVARQLSTVVVTLLAVLLTGLVAVGELLLGLIWFFWGGGPWIDLLVGLSATMLPYLLLICVAAQLSTMLYAAGHFAVPALAPMTLNIIWLAAAWIGARWFTGDQVAQAYLLAAAVIVSGVAQILVHLPMLRRLGYHFDFNWSAARAGVVRIGRNMAPAAFGLAILQVNMFISIFIAMGLASAPDGPQTISWLGGVHYPMREGAVAALYFGDRLCSIPFSLVGWPVAVAIFPLLSRHAARGDRRLMGDDMTLGLRLVLCLSVPAGVGLALLAQPITRLLFERGSFTADDTVRVAWVTVGYAVGVWANCAWPVIVRGFYAVHDFRTPVRIGVWIVAINVLLNVTLIWPLAEAGLALSAATAGVVQLLALIAVFSRRLAPLGWRSLGVTAVRSVLATAAMGVVVYFVLAKMPEGSAIWSQIARVVASIAAGTATYVVAYLLMGGRELGMLVHGKTY